MVKDFWRKTYISLVCIITIPRNPWKFRNSPITLPVIHLSCLQKDWKTDKRATIKILPPPCCDLRNKAKTSDSVSVPCCPLTSQFEYTPRCQIRAAPGEWLWVDALLELPTPGRLCPITASSTNRKYMTYCNAARRWPIHGYRQHAQDTLEVCSRTDRHTDRQPDSLMATLFSRKRSNDRRLLTLLA